MIKEVNGMKVQYGGVISPQAFIKFNFWQRIKILFGRNVRIRHKIFTKHKTDVVHIEVVSEIISTKQIIKRAMKPAEKK